MTFLDSSLFDCCHICSHRICPLLVKGLLNYPPIHTCYKHGAHPCHSRITEHTVKVFFFLNVLYII